MRTLDIQHRSTMTVVKAMVVATLTAMVVHAELVIYPNPNAFRKLSS